MIYSGAHSTQSVPCPSQRPQRRTEKELGQDVAFTSKLRAVRREKGCNLICFINKGIHREKAEGKAFLCILTYSLEITF